MGKEESLQQLAARCNERDFVSRVPGFSLLVFWPDEDTSPVIAFRTAALDVETFKRAHIARASKKFDAVRLVKSSGSPYSDWISVGRARNCDVVIRDSSVSKLHAHFRIDETSQSVVITDLGSHNGTLLDGRALSAQKPAVACSGSQLQFGSIRAELVDAPSLYAALR